MQVQSNSFLGDLMDTSESQTCYHEMEHTSTKVTNRNAAGLFWRPKMGTPSNASVWKFSVKQE